MQTLFTIVFICSLCSTALSILACDDEERSFCATIIKDRPEMCSDSCFVDFCKRSCNKCPLTCRDCYGVSRPEDCNVTMTCPGTNYACAMSKTYTHTFEEQYMLGCAKMEQCQRTTTTPSTTTTSTTTSTTLTTTTTKPTSDFTWHQDLIGKRNALGDLSCCETDECNSKTPPESTVVKRSVVNDYHMVNSKRSESSTCADVNPTACLYLYMVMSDVCTKHSCVAASLCPQMCGACYECYQCTGVASVGDCNTTTVCNRGQKCYLMETLTMDLNIQTNIGCTDINVCSKFETLNQQNIFGRRKRSSSLRGGCCSGNKCNGNLMNFVGTNKDQVSTRSSTTTTSTTTTTPLPTAKTITTPSPTTTTTTPRPTTSTTTTPRPSTTSTTTTTSIPTTTTPIECFHQPGQCPGGFTMTAHGCFTATRTKMTWSNAKIYCNSKCAKLADFETSQEIQEVINEMTKSHHSSLYHHSVKAFVDGHYENRAWTWDSTRHHVPNNLVSSSSFHHLSTHHDYCLTVSTVSEDRRRRDGSSRAMVQTELKPKYCDNHYYPLCEFTQSLRHYYNPVPLVQISNNGGGD